MGAIKPQGIIKPREPEADIVIYSKWCIQCEHPEWLLALNIWAQTQGLTTQVIRTAYRPADHQKATELWASRSNTPKDETPEEAADYPSFIVWEEIISLKGFIEMIKEPKNKMVKGGKTKNDMQRLPKTKRSSRKKHMAAPVDSGTLANDLRPDD